jgi:hypothetical protein
MYARRKETIIYEPAEVRAYTAIIPSDRKNIPEYFKIMVE